MKQLLFFLLFSIATHSQSFTNVDNVVAQYPRFSKVEKLATKIKKDFSLDKDKVRAAFFWLANNIRYNLEEYYNPTQRSYHFRYSTEVEKQQKLQAVKDKIVADVFNTKFGVCEDYAQSFKKICDLLNIEAAVIKGNVRNTPQEIGKPEQNTNHAWNGVKINGKWLILDATWAAGFAQNGRWVKQFDNYFYDIPTDKILKTHYPEDSLWMLRFGRMSIEDFYNQPIYGKAFLNSKTELISPKTGIINLKSSENITLKFKNLDTTSLIFYNFKGHKYAQKPTIQTANGITTLTLKKPNRNADLVLYINKEDALHFKVRVQ